MKKMISFLVLLLLLLAGCTPKEESKVFEYETKEITIVHNSLTLDGEIIVPKTTKKVPGVVIVPGSGLVDMNGTMDKLVPYKELAEGLAKKGIASIRFNKVNYQHLASLQANYTFSIEDEFISDALQAIAKLRAEEVVDNNKIYLVGHSMGAQIVPTIALRDENIKGLILMAGTPYHLLDVLLEQMLAKSEDIYNQSYPYAEKAKSFTTVPKDEENKIYFGAYPAYWVSYNALMKDEDILKITSPILVLQGELDLQVPVAHFNQYKEILKNNNKVTYRLYEKLNHCFSNGEGEAVENAYSIYRRFSPEVIQDISNFILGK